MSKPLFGPSEFHLVCSNPLRKTFEDASENESSEFMKTNTEKHVEHKASENQGRENHVGYGKILLNNLFLRASMIQ